MLLCWWTSWCVQQYRSRCRNGLWTPTGEEDETQHYSKRATLFRLRANEWKQRGRSDVKMLMNQEKGKVCCFMRKQIMESIVCNFYVMNVASFCELEPHLAFMCISEKVVNGWLSIVPMTNQRRSSWRLHLRQFMHAFEDATVLDEALKYSRELIMTESKVKDMGLAV